MLILDLWQSFYFHVSLSSSVLFLGVLVIVNCDTTMFYDLTLMLLVANLSNTKLCINLKKNA